MEHQLNSEPAAILTPTDECDLEGRVSEVRAHAIDVLEKEENVVAWLQCPNLALGGERPLDLLNSGNWEKVDQVNDVLYRIEYGMFS